ncbi:unnamed protein product [Polarella glacialis]|uniref:Uncharacterized protein n=1 Tax=Polarella glacialis TaxID=89957 RepID=A0A813GLT0_POLGL|nr:unnamed protein product [Polarella glacialis]CAE8631269.1 unnamed protein product [Polarella glacialis]
MAELPLPASLWRRGIAWDRTLRQLRSTKLFTLCRKRRSEVGAGFSRLASAEDGSSAPPLGWQNALSHAVPAAASTLDEAADSVSTLLSVKAAASEGKDLDSDDRSAEPCLQEVEHPAEPPLGSTFGPGGTAESRHQATLTRMTELAQATPAGAWQRFRREFEVQVQIWDSQALLQKPLASKTELRFELQALLGQTTHPWTAHSCPGCSAALQSTLLRTTAEELLNDATWHAAGLLVEAAQLASKRWELASELEEAALEEGASHSARIPERDFLQRRLELVEACRLQGHLVLEYCVRRMLRLPMSVPWASSSFARSSPRTRGADAHSGDEQPGGEFQSNAHSSFQERSDGSWCQPFECSCSVAVGTAVPEEGQTCRDSANDRV